MRSQPPTGSNTVNLDLNAICVKHLINPNHRAEFHALVLHGRRPSKEVRNRLKLVGNYKAALEEAMAVLSAPYAHLFAEAPEAVEHYESLEVSV
jgi:hypothetical protein